MVAGVVFSALVYIESHEPGFNGIFSPSLNLAAQIFTAILAIILVGSLIIYFLAYFGFLTGRIGDILSIVMRAPMGRKGASICSTSVRRVPICSWGPCKCLTVPERTFFPA